MQTFYSFNLLVTKFSLTTNFVANVSVFNTIPTCKFELPAPQNLFIHVIQTPSAYSHSLIQ